MLIRSKPRNEVEWRYSRHSADAPCLTTNLAFARNKPYLFVVSHEAKGEVALFVSHGTLLTLRALTTDMALWHDGGRVSPVLTTMHDDMWGAWNAPEKIAGGLRPPLLLFIVRLSHTLFVVSCETEANKIGMCNWEWRA